MKSIPLLHLMAAGTLWVLSAAKCAAQTWQTVDQFQLVPGLPSSAGDIGVDAGGSLFCVGSGDVTANGAHAAAVRASTDGGQSWTSLDAFLPTGWSFAHYRGFGAAPNGSLFAGGELWDGNTFTRNWVVQQSTDGGANWSVSDLIDLGTGSQASCGDIKASPSGAIYAAGRNSHWLVRRSINSGATWNTVDEVPAAGLSEARAIAFHPNGSIFVAGHLYDPQTGTSQWGVRRSLNDGATWTTVDTYAEERTAGAGAEDITVDNSGALYVAGTARIKAKNLYIDYWVVRRSVDAGATWTSVDKFSINNQAPSPTGIALDSAGRIYVCGYSGQPTHWLVRKGTPGNKGTITWIISDDYQLATGQSARANDITRDQVGNMLVTGRVADTSGTDQWLVRKQAP